MSLPAGYELRAPTRDDLHAVAAVLMADEIADAGQVVLDADFLEEEWARAAFDLASDAWVVVDGAGLVVGHGQVVREEQDLVESWGVVHPEHRGRGIGSALLDRIEDRAAQLLTAPPSGRFRHAINAGDSAAAAMLRARGLRPARHFRNMRIDLAGPLAVDRAPAGIRIDAVQPPDDLVAVHAVLEAAFAGDWSHHPEPFDRWAQERTGSPTYDPTLWLLAREGGEPVGALVATAGGDRGWVHELAVLASHRGRGIGAALLQRSFATFARRGVRQVLLNVDAQNPTGATALYERAGMRVVKRWEMWERP